MIPLLDINMKIDQEKNRFSWDRGQTFVFFITIILSLLIAGVAFAQVEKKRIPSIPEYILNGLQAYEREGYEAAVKKWFENSPWANATVLVSRNAFLKNIEMMYGKYQSYDIITTKETPTSQMTYIRFNYERMSGYGMFISSRHNNQWFLSDLDLHKMQKIADTP
jgi:hypothetical protein